MSTSRPPPQQTHEEGEAEARVAEGLEELFVALVCRHVPVSGHASAQPRGGQLLFLYTEDPFGLSALRIHEGSSVFSSPSPDAQQLAAQEGVKGWATNTQRMSVFVTHSSSPGRKSSLVALRMSAASIFTCLYLASTHGTT